MRDSDTQTPNPPGDAGGRPLFTDADVALMGEAIAREEQRIWLVCELRGIVIDPDDHTGRLGNLAGRLRQYIRQQAPGRVP